MIWRDLLSAIGGVGALVAIGAFIGRNLVEKMGDGVLKRFEHSLQTAQANHEAMLARAEAEHQAKLRHAEELHKSATAFSASVDTDLRTRRAAVYQELWKCTGLLSAWPRNTELTYDQIADLSKQFKQWYFEKGGIYLSESARKAYGDVQERIVKVLGYKSTGLVDPREYEEIRKQCSTLRTWLTRDLLSRREAPHDETESPSSRNDKGGTVDLNTADLEEIADLPKDGRNGAEDMIKARPFKSWDDVAGHCSGG